MLLWEASREQAAGASQEVEEEAEQVEEDVEEEMEKPEQELLDIQRACLHFCITLLDQQVGAHKYKSALVYTLAVLSVQRDR